MSLLRMRNLLPLALALAAGSAAAASAPGAPAEAARPVGWKLRRPSVEARKPLPPVPLLIERLSSPKFVERAEATRDLARSGPAAIEPLRAAAASDRPEVSIRAVAALEDLWLRAMEADDGETASAALAALDELALSEDPALRGRVESLLASYASEIEPFAINEIRRLGGGIRYREGMSVVGDDGSIRPEVQFVVIGPTWTGGEKGLRHIRRIRPSGVLGVYFIRTAPLPDGAVERFTAAAPPNVQAVVRGPSYLGVSSKEFPAAGGQGVFVDQAAPGSPAAKAGVKSNDVIIEFNGRPIGVFANLTDELEKLRPGQTVDAVVLRGGDRVPLKVTLEEWK